MLYRGPRVSWSPREIDDAKVFSRGEYGQADCHAPSSYVSLHGLDARLLRPGLILVTVVAHQTNRESIEFLYVRYNASAINDVQSATLFETFSVQGQGCFWVPSGATMNDVTFSPNMDWIFASNFQPNIMSALPTV